MDKNTIETFNYTYSAMEQEEIKSIREKYVAPVEVEDKMIQLRRLDQSVTSKATMASLVVGITGALVLGLGMSLAMTELSEIFGSYNKIGIILGIVISIVGIILVCFAYPVYNRTINKEREKIAPEILRLTDELMK